MGWSLFPRRLLFEKRFGYNFNQANGALPANFVSTSNGPTVSGNQLVNAGTGQWITRYDVPTNSGEIQYSQGIFKGPRLFGVAVGITGFASGVGSGGAAASNHYFFRKQISTTGWSIGERLAGSTNTTIFGGSDTFPGVASDIVSGDVIRLEYGDFLDGTGLTLRVLINGVEQVRYQPAVNGFTPITGQNYVGFSMQIVGTAGDPLLDDWVGGSYKVTAPATMAATGTATVSVTASGAGAAPAAGTATVSVTATGTASDGTITYTDDFERTGPDPGANWIGTANGMTISGGRLPHARTPEGAALPDQERAQGWLLMAGQKVPRMGPKDHVRFVPDHKSFGEFIRSAQMRKPVVEVSQDIAKRARKLSPRRKSGVTPDGLAMADQFQVDEKAGVIKVAGNVRLKVNVFNSARSAAPNEFGGKRNTRHRMLGRAGAEFGDFKGKGAEEFL